MQTYLALTVAESKRLIARGLVQLPEVKKAKQNGLIAICTGTTNAYIVEELLGEKIDKTRYRTGITVPTGTKPPFLGKQPLGDMVLRKGVVDTNLDRFTVLPLMKENDVYIKGANALNYQENIAGILIGHPTAGTIGGAIGTLVSRKIRFLIPIGLEKQISANILNVHRCLAAPGTKSPRMMPVFGRIFTEIEALWALAGVKAVQVGAGGVAGAEGSVHLLVSGTKAQLDKAGRILDRIYGEPPFAG